MPYYLMDDEWADDPSWDVLSGGSAALTDALQAAFARLASRVSGTKRDGYVTERLALDCCRGKKTVLALLCKRVLNGQVWLHRPGDDCPCLGAEPWIDGYAYRIHNFLKRNPSKREYDLQRAKKADLRDARLKALVYRRDGGCCRYCGSGPLEAKAVRAKDRRRVLTFDHVDPDKPAGADGGNLVVACGRCNDEKGHRTPDEAEMPLLPEPSPDEAAQLAAREQQRHDRPTHRPNQLPISDQISDESTTDQQQRGDPVTDRVADPVADPEPASDGEPRPETAPIDHESPPTQGSEGSLLGRGGKPAADPIHAPPPTPRSGLYPDPYTHRSRPPPAHLDREQEAP